GTPVAPPVGARPTSTPIGQAKPVGATPSAATAARPPTPTGPLKPTVPQKREETKQEVSRRNFLKGLAVLGGIVALAQFAPVVGGFMNGSTEGTATPKQAIIDLKTGLPLKTTDISENNWTTFVYPRTDNPNIDSDTFRQCVLIHIPKNFTAPSSLSVKDPISGDTFVALSRVCVHLWCLWSYFPSDDKGICPCHGSQYVPGDGPPYHEPPGYAVGGPASLQAPPNNMLPVITLSADPDGTLYATGIVGQVGCGQKC
ncbi:MAG: twin-arginine translocation signal domain-containing protein, partial [Nitrososphaerota archaeon]|nr:twin-arginine translocation signal domain-containing protein [Nitrososphaerota archaeon]